MAKDSFSRSYVTGTAAIIAGLFVLIAAVLVRDTTLGWPTALIDRWYFTVGAVALIVLGACVRREATTFGVLAFFLIAGGAAQLYVTDPTFFPALHLEPQNWKEWALVGVIAAEAAVALAVLSRAGLGRVMGEARQRLGVGKLALFVAMSGLLSVPILGFVVRNAGPEYAAHVVVGSALTLIHLAVMAAMSQVASPISGLYRLSALAPATVAFAISLVLSFEAFEAIPHSAAEVAYQFQSRLFAGGALVAPVPPEAALPGLAYPLFDVRDGAWFAVTAPGWPVLLAAGQLLGAPWLVNPVLAALCVLMAHAIAIRLSGRDEADLVAMMMGASPWLLAMSATLLPFTFALALTLFAWLMILRALERRRLFDMRLVLAGLAVGWLFAALPIEGTIIAAVTGLWLLFGAIGSPVRAVQFAAGGAVSAGLALAYNLVLTGSATLSPARAYFDRVWSPGADRIGFGADVGPPTVPGIHDLWPGHTLGEGLLGVLNSAASLSHDLMGWSVGSFALVLAFLLWQRINRADLLMLGVIVALIGGFVCYWDAAEQYFGPQGWFLTVFPFFFLSARGYQAIRARFPDKGDLATIRIDSLFWYACIFGACVFLPWRAVTKYYEFGDFHPTVIEDAASGQFDGKVVLVRPNGNPGSTLMLNDPWLAGTVWLVDTGALDKAALAAAFPGREVVAYANEWTGR